MEEGFQLDAVSRDAVIKPTPTLPFELPKFGSPNDVGILSIRFGLSGLVLAVPVLPLDPMLPPSRSLLGLFELAIENTPESAWLAGESLLDASRGDSFVG